MQFHIHFFGDMKNVESSEYFCNSEATCVLGPTYKKSIDDIAEMLCDKLESLEVHSIKISPLKLLAIQMEVSLNIITNH